MYCLADRFLSTKAKLLSYMTLLKTIFYHHFNVDYRKLTRFFIAILDLIDNRFNVR